MIEIKTSGDHGYTWSVLQDDYNTLAALIAVQRQWAADGTIAVVSVEGGMTVEITADGIRRS